MTKTEIKHKAQDLLVDSMITAGYRLYESISDEEISTADKELVFPRDENSSIKST